MFPKRYNFSASGSCVSSLSSSPLSTPYFPGVRYSTTTTTKGPSGNGNDNGNPENGKMNSGEAAWIERRQQEQRFQRQPRFAPKSRKSFQTASPSKQYGARPLTKNLRLIKDSFHVPILIPGQTLSDDSKDVGRTGSVRINTDERIQQNKNNADQNDGKQSQVKAKSELNHMRRRRRMLPTVNASALLDAPTYCRNSAFTATGSNKNSNEQAGMTMNSEMNSKTAAAKRLLRGKKDLLNMLRGDIILQESPRPFCLAGHGVPKQLLQEHINMGDSILHHFNEPAEVSVRNSDPCYPEAMKIREHNGQSRMWLWPTDKTTEPHQLLEEQQRRAEEAEVAGDSLQDISQTWGERLDLYIAVMDRLASGLWPSGSCFNKKSRQHWSLKIYRGMAFPVEVIAGADADGPVPVLEWNPLHRISKRQPHMSIRLQGTPDLVPGASQESVNPVTLVYDARFQEEPRLEPATA